MNYLETGAITLQRQMELYAGISLRYRRPNSLVDFSIIGVPGRNPVDMTDANGVLLRGQIQDFTVDIAKFKSHMDGVDPSLRHPLRNDEIHAEYKTMKIVYLVNGENVAVSHFESSDSYGIAWRIHTKADRFF